MFGPIEIASLTTYAGLTVVAAFETGVFSVLAGCVLAVLARQRPGYVWILVVLLIPFSLGPDVWAYALATLATHFGAQGRLLGSGDGCRASVLLTSSVSKSLPLGVFFCATILHRHLREVGPYARAHRLMPWFSVMRALERVPRSVPFILGMFGGGLMATETAVPLFLYRANPGTGPETPNIMLWRIFREIYANRGPEAMPILGTMGIMVSVVLLVAAVAGSSLARVTIARMGSMMRSAGVVRWRIVVAAGGACLVASIVPGLVSLVGIAVALTDRGAAGQGSALLMIRYSPIATLGVVLGSVISLLGVGVAVGLRYGKRNWLETLYESTGMSAICFVPAFLPLLTVVVIMGSLTRGAISGLFAYGILAFSHLALHLPVYGLFCATWIADIPEAHVLWQRAMGVSYWYSLYADGFKRNQAGMACLSGLAAIQIITDGSVSRWFSGLVASPGEALNAAVFGRMSNSGDAAAIVSTMAVVALVLCVLLARTSTNEPKST